MRPNEDTRAVKRSAVAVWVTAVLCLGFAAPLLSAPTPESAAAQSLSRDASAAIDTKSAQKCLSDLHAFRSQMRKDGYWLQGSDTGYGYPIYGHGDGESGTSGNIAAPQASGYWRARPRYEIRTLIASATILAHRGQQPECEALLTATRDIYESYAADMRNGGMALADMPGRRRHQIAAAQPVIGNNVSYRSDQFIGTDVVNWKDQNLGSVKDIVHRPQTGTIAYLVIARGGVFGIGAHYVPVPWEHLKATVGTNLLVLDTTTKQLDAAPQVKEGHRTEIAVSGNHSSIIPSRITSPSGRTRWSVSRPERACTGSAADFDGHRALVAAALFANRSQ